MFPRDSKVRTKPPGNRPSFLRTNATSRQRCARQGQVLHRRRKRSRPAPTAALSRRHLTGGVSCLRLFSCGGSGSASVGHLHQHHPIEMAVLVPSAQPADLPIIESRTQFHWIAQAKEFGFHRPPFLTLLQPKWQVQPEGKKPAGPRKLGVVAAR